MKRIFHRTDTLFRLPFLVVLGLATLLWGGTYAYTQNSETGSSKTQIKSESIEFTSTPSSYKRYTGPQNAQELMKALDEGYTKALSKKPPETKVIISDGSLVIRNGEILERPKTTTYSSDLTINEIEARYPRAEWLQLLLERGITIDNSDEYASLLSKRYLLALLEDNPDLYEAGYRGIPPTDDWETYKAAYIKKLVNDHTKIQKSAKQIERAKAQIEQSKEKIKRSKAQIERSRVQIKLALKRSKESIARAMTQLEHSIEQVKGDQKALNSQQLAHVRKQLEQARKQIQRAQEALEHPEEPTHPQEPN